MYQNQELPRYLDPVIFKATCSLKIGSAFYTDPHTSDECGWEPYTPLWLCVYPDEFLLSCMTLAVIVQLLLKSWDWFDLLLYSFSSEKKSWERKKKPPAKKKNKLKKPYPVKNYHQFVRIRLHPPQTRTLSGSAVLSAGWHTLLLTWCKIEIASSMETEGAAAFQVTSPWVTVPEKTVNSVLSSFKVPPALLLQQSLANKRNVAQNTASCC